MMPNAIWYGRKNLDTRFSYERLKRQKALSITWNASRGNDTRNYFWKHIWDFHRIGRRKFCVTFSIAEAKRIY